MAKRITKKDPKEELSGFINHNSNKKEKNNHKVSTSLKRLNAERHRSLKRKLGAIIGISAIIVAGLSYYVSPQANVKSVRVNGTNEINPNTLVKQIGIKPTNKVVFFLLNQSRISNKLAKQYPEFSKVNVSVRNLNNVTLDIKSASVSAYLQADNHYYKILADGKVGKLSLPWSKVDHDRPLFVNFSNKNKLETDIVAFKNLPIEFQNQVKLVNGKTARPTQTIFLMKDGNVVVGNSDTIDNKIKYYSKIEANLSGPSLIDLEVGGFSRPLTSQEKKSYSTN